MSTAEVMTLALISTLHYQRDYRLIRLVSHHLKYFPTILSRSRLVRRIHAISDVMWWAGCRDLLRDQLKMDFISKFFFIMIKFPIEQYRAS